MKANRIKLTDGLEFSRIVHGHMRLSSWNISAQELVKLTEHSIELGVTTIDHADFYGNYRCEKLFGEALKLDKNLRRKVEIVTKCGIQILSDQYPERKLKHYDYTYDHILSSVDHSLKNLNTDYIDLFLLHRPAPFFDPEAVAKAFSILKAQGKVLNFGVSNFTPGQFEMLASYTEDKLVTNQVEISPYCLEHFENGNIDYFMKERIKPMAWSPLAWGKLLIPSDLKGERIRRVIEEIAAELGVHPVENIIYSWLLNHPATIMPIVGTGKIERIKEAVEAMNIEMSLEQWYKIYNASTGTELP